MSLISAPAMVYVSGEEMTRYAMQLILKNWIEPHIDISKWEFFDLSAKHRSDTDDQVLRDVISAGARVRSIFKEPTVTPTKDQSHQWGVKHLGSPNGAMRRGWNGISISRDTVHIDGVALGFKTPVLFDRQAVGGEYNAKSHQTAGAGRAVTTFHPDDGGQPVEIEQLSVDLRPDDVLVQYVNPTDSTRDMARHFFSRSLEAGVTPYIVTKKTVFKFQEVFWDIMREVFDAEYKEAFSARGLLDSTYGKLAHLISDAATMSLVKWHEGGFSMAAHNYDGDMLTDLISQLHRSPAFITSVLIGRNEEGQEIREFEASHGTVSDMNKRRLKGQETSFNPLGLIEALTGAMEFAAKVDDDGSADEIKAYNKKLKTAIEQLIKEGKGTRDVCGPTGLNTEDFVDEVARMI